MSDAFPRPDGVHVLAVHGFGASAAVWAPLAQRLPPPLLLSALDLPGHGGVPRLSHCTLSALTEACARQLSVPAIWLGWSLGGLVALHAARLYPEKVLGVVTVAMTPHFLAAEDWPNGVDAHEFEHFERLLRSDVGKALDRFYALQTHSRLGASPRLSRTLRQLALSRGAPESRVLEETLAVLRGTDLRDEAANLACPVMAVLGEDDALVPHAACEDLSRLNPLWRVEVIEAAGHVPFLSHADAFIDLLQSFAMDLHASRGAA